MAKKKKSAPKPAKKSKPAKPAKPAKKAAKPVKARKPVKPTRKAAAKPGKKAAAKKSAPKPARKPAKAAAKGKKAAAPSKSPSKSAKKAPAAPAKPTAPVKQYVPDVERPTGMYGGVVVALDIKPFPKTSPYSKQELETLKKALLQERELLRRELASMDGSGMGSVDGEKESGFSTHDAEYASDIQATETLLGVRSLEEERLNEVEQALQRIDTKNNYGLCLACGNKIGIQRLIAKPHAHLCMDCRLVFERKRSG